MKTKLIGSVVIGLLVLSFSATAETPSLITFQGRLLDDAGQPLSTNVNAELYIYTVESGGSPEYDEYIGDVAVQDGMYSFAFGTNRTALLNVLTNNACWVELVINSEPLSPRQRLLSMPYAMNADTLDGMDSALFATGTPLYAYTETDPVWAAEKSGYATGTPLYAFTETDPVWTTASTNYYLKAEADTFFATGTPVYAESDPVWESEKSNYATGTPLYAFIETDPIWLAEKSGYATGTPLYVFTESDPIWTTQSTNYYDKSEIDSATWANAQYPNAVLVDGSRFMTGTLDMSNNDITNVLGIELGGEYRDSWPSLPLATYVEKTGDIMTGPLVMNVGADKDLVIGSEGTNIAIGSDAAVGAGSERIAIGRHVTNRIDDSIAVRGSLYLDGGTNIYYRNTFGVGVWQSLFDQVSITETDPVWNAEKADYYTKTQADSLFATGTPLYAYTETDPVWLSEKSNYATGTPLYAFTESDPIWSTQSTNYYDKTDIDAATWTDAQYPNALLLDGSRSMTGRLTINDGANNNLIIDSAGTDIMIGNLATGYWSSVAIGEKANACNFGTAVGWWANASDWGVAVGRDSDANYGGFVLGYQSQATNRGIVIGYQAQGSDYGVGIGMGANAKRSGIGIGSPDIMSGERAVRAWDYGIAVGVGAYGEQTNIAIGVYADTKAGSERIAIGHNVTNAIDNSAAIRGSLYLDGGTGLYYRASFGTGEWDNLLEDVVVTESMISDGAITSAKLATGAVQSVNIADGAVTATQLAAGAVDSSALAENAVTSSHIATNAIQNKHISQGSVSYTKLQTRYLMVTNPLPKSGEVYGGALARLGQDRFIIGDRSAYGVTSYIGGAVYMYDLDLNLLQTITNPTTDTIEWFGDALAGLDDYFAVGATRDDTGATYAGRVYVYDHDGNPVVSINNPFPDASDHFGFPLAGVGTNIFAIGARDDDALGTGVGIVYVYNVDGIQLGTLNNPTPVNYDNFPDSLAGVGSTTIVASLIKESSYDGVVYLFDTAGNLNRTISNPSPGSGSKFGSSVAAVGDTMFVVGAPYYDNASNDIGIAYLFDRDGTLVTTITNPVSRESDYFGWRVAGVGSDKIAISVKQDDGLNPTKGVVYVFDTSGNLLDSFPNPLPVDAASGAWYGTVLASVGDSTALVGAPGYQYDPVESRPGAVYFCSVGVQPSITFGAFQDNVIMNDYLMEDAVTTDKIEDGTIVSDDLADGTISGTKLLDDSVDNTKLLDGAVTTDKILDGAVTSSKLYGYVVSSGITITNPTPAASDYFGDAPACIGTNYYAVGVPYDDVAGVNDGAVYLFDMDGTLVNTITNPSPVDDDFFGCAVASIATNWILIGAYGDDTGASGSGIAYVYDTDGTLQLTMTNPLSSSSDKFGYSVAACGNDRFIIGSPNSELGTSFNGVAFLYDLSGSLLVTITNPITGSQSYFGSAMSAVGTDMVLITAPGWYMDEWSGLAGKAHIFDHDGALIRTLTNSPSAFAYRFGNSCSGIGSDQFIVGASLDSSVMPWEASGGKAFIYNTSGVQLAVMTNTVLADDSDYGIAVANGGGAFFVGATKAVSEGSMEGGVFAYDANGTVLAQIQNPSPDAGDQFGYAMGGSADGRVIIAVRFDDTSAENAGIAYTYNAAENRAVNTAAIEDDAVTSDKIANGAAMTDVLANDGPGSGLNADLLDGFDSTHFATGTPVYAESDPVWSAASNLYMTIDGSVMTGPLVVSNSLTVGTADDYAEITTNGELRLHGDATAWDDLKFQAFAQKIDTAAGVLDWDYDNIGIIFENGCSIDNNGEKIHMVAQLPHAWKEGSIIHPHIHWIQTSEDSVDWYMEYRWYNNGTNVPTAFITNGPATNVFAYTAGNTNAQISSFGTIDGTGKSLSSIIDIRISRDGDNDAFDGDALYKEFDIHYEIDSFGSSSQFEK